MGLRISSIALSSLGDRRKGYPKWQALWELTLALGRFSIDVAFLFCSNYVHSVVILNGFGYHFSFGDFENEQCAFFDSSLSFYSVAEFG